MAKRRERALGADDIEDLRHDVADLTQHVRLLVDAIDALREEVQWLTHNGLPTGERPASSVLKKMAADPCAADWSERLVVARGESSPAREGEGPTGSSFKVPPSQRPADETRPPSDQPGQLF